MPERINKVIELLASGQPVYYTGPSSRGYEGGQKDAQTWADYINYDFEHGPFDMTVLREYMRGLVDGGPTKSGHRTPAVVVTLPVTGTSEATVRANAWQIAHVLSAGVHGICLATPKIPPGCAPSSPTRWAFQTLGVGEGQLGVGRMGNGGQGYAADLGWSRGRTCTRPTPGPSIPRGSCSWGSRSRTSGPWPTPKSPSPSRGSPSPSGAPGTWGSPLASSTATTRPTRRRWGARARVLAGCKANNVAFLNQTRPPDVVDMIAEGVRSGQGARRPRRSGAGTPGAPCVSVVAPLWGQSPHPPHRSRVHGVAG